MTIFRAGWTPTNNDPAGNVAAGWIFSADVVISISAIGFFKSAGNPPATIRAKLWDSANQVTPVSDTGSVDISAQPAGWVDLTLPAPIAVPSGANYVPSVEVPTGKDIAYSPNDLTSPIISPDGHITVPAGGGRFIAGTGYPASTWNGMHGVRITYTLGSGSGLANLGALNAIASGQTTVVGSASANLGPLNATASASPPPPMDQYVSELMDRLLQCLCEKAAQAPGPPKHCCFRVGLEVAHDAGINQDQCCEGIAYVALGDTYPSSGSFPEADVVRQADAKCPPTTWAQQFKVGIIRCIPVGDEFDPLSCNDWNAASRQNVADAQTLRRVACCIRNFVTKHGSTFLGMSLVIERQTQSTPQGGCVERSMMITAQFPNNCDGC